MDRRYRVVGAAAAAAVLLAACGGGPDDDRAAAGRVQPAESPESQEGGHTADAWSFASAETDTDAPDGAGSSDGAVPRGDDYRPADATDAAGFEEMEPRYWQPGDPAVPPGMELTNPCMLVTTEEFTTWAGRPLAGAPIVLEDGEACGFIVEGDRLRMAVGVIPISAGDQRFLPAPGDGLDAGDVHPVEGVTAPLPLQRVVWVPRHPVEDSNVLVVEADGFDLVVEMSSRDGRSLASLRDGAVRFATLALGRLS